MRVFLVLMSLVLVTGIPAARAQDVPRPVKVVTVTEGDAVLRRQFFGIVAARQTVDLAFAVSGQLRSFPVLEGETLAEGDMIAELDLEPFRIARDQAVVQKEQADRALARLTQLSEGLTTQTALDDARTNAELAAIRVREAEYNLENATLLAPFAGLVAAKNVANFTTINAGTAIVRLHDVSEWRVEIDVPEVLFRRAGEDADLSIVGTFTGSDRRIPLELREFQAEASAVGQTFRITLAMLEEPGSGVLPGSSITVTVELAAESQGMPIPASAVVIGDDGTTSVMIFEGGEGETGTVRRQAITLATGSDGELFVAGGIEPGTEIVVAGAKDLEDGQPVRRFTGFAN